MRLLSSPWLLGTCMLAVLSLTPAKGQQDASELYLQSNVLAVRFEALAQQHPSFCSIEHIGAKVQLVTLGKLDENKPKPAMLLLGSLRADEHLPAHACYTIAATLLENAEAKELLSNVALYMIPDALPESRSLAFARPALSIPGVLAPYDDDHDRTHDEDGPADINGDGMITQMRIKRDGGRYRIDEDGLMLKAQHGEIGTHDLLWEGIDNDDDGKINEDPVGSVTLSNDWVTRWSHKQEGSANFPMQLEQTLTIADFVIAHPNISYALSLSSIGKQLEAAKGPPKSSLAYKKLKDKAIPMRDHAALDALGKVYAELTGKPEKVASLSIGSGNILDWLYEVRGVIALRAPLYQLPKPRGGGGGQDYEDHHAAPANSKSKRAKRDSKSGRRDRASIDTESSDTPKEESSNDVSQDDKLWHHYTPEHHHAWKSFEHLTLGKVEIGGWEITARHDPRPGDADTSFKAHTEFVHSILQRLPTVTVTDVEYEKRDDNLYLVRLRVFNPSKSDLRSQFGADALLGIPLLASISDSKAIELISGMRKQRVHNLQAGHTRDFEWLVRADGIDAELNFTITSNDVITLTHTVALKDCALKSPKEKK